MTNRRFGHLGAVATAVVRIVSRVVRLHTVLAGLAIRFALKLIERLAVRQGLGEHRRYAALTFGEVRIVLQVLLVDHRVAGEFGRARFAAGRLGRAVQIRRVQIRCVLQVALGGCVRRMVKRIQAGG